MTRRLPVVCLALAFHLVGPRAARAQQEDARVVAAARFERALALFDEGNTSAALIEFEAIYADVGEWRLLYNIGACHRALGHPVEALDAWERYLEEGGEVVEVARREQIAAALVELRGRIGRVLVRTNVEGAQITVDGVAVATAPIAEPLRLAIGEYRLGVEAAGWQAPERRIVVAGESEQIVDVLLEAVVTERGSLEIRSAVPDVEISVDGRAVGATPLSESVVVSPGAHVVEGRRRGFVTARSEVSVSAGQRADVTLALPIDPDASAESVGALQLRLPLAGYTLYVNGAEVEASRGRVELPVGRHHLRLAVEQRVEHRETVTVVAGETLEREPALRWQDGIRSISVSDAERLRIAGIATLVAGASALVAAAVFVGVAEGHLVAEREANRDDYETCTQTGAMCSIAMENNANEYLTDAALQDSFRWVYGIAFFVGAIAPTLGAIMIALAPSEDAIDAGASARLRLELGVGRLALSGDF